MSLIISSIKYSILNDIKTISEFFTNKKPHSEDNYNEIIPGLYLGNYDAACSKKFILEKDIDLVVNCSNNLEFPKFYKDIEKLNFKYIRIPLDDSFDTTDQDIMAVSLQKICPVIHNYITNDQNVFIHCYAGMQRSATVVLCYLIYKHYKENHKIYKLKSYYDFLILKRVVVFHPDPTFINVIYKYHKNIIMQKDKDKDKDKDKII